MKLKIIAMTAVLILITAVIYFLTQPLQKQGTDSAVVSVLPKIELQPMFFEKNNFFSAIEKAKDIKKEKNIQAIVVPHHLLVSEYITGLIKRASGRQIDTVVIIGPNHENISQEILATTLAEWQTLEGSVSVDETLVNIFLADFKEQSNYEAFIHEHSIGAIVPFVKHYFPKAKIMPVIINSYANLQDGQKLATWLDKNLGDNSLVIVSTDFSHYLEKPMAEKNDLQTRQWIMTRDTGSISRLNNDYVDSPISLATILLLAEKRGWGTEEIYHGNSFDFSLQKPVQTTSYFGLGFTE
ncbi:MAG TPA: AmmeMemoRadiSam system protein B [Candidatus Magasanikbacteria bacterium]|nr:AmmeMemoRadiSam system protein B [Candidatus Magasanikbacteria bacterium]